MTKYKLTIDNGGGSQVTLTRYMADDGTKSAIASGGTVNPAFEPTEGNICSGCQKKSTILTLPNESYPRKRTKPSTDEWLKDKLKSGCTRKVLLKRVPILSWLPTYSLDFAISDFLAGVTVGLTVIPQAIAYANIAGLEPQIGLYSAFVGALIYAILGSCKDSAIGPTAISALLTRENIHGLGALGSTLLCFLSGCVVFLMGVFQMGFLIDFISGPVSVGFTSAAAIIIATTQLKDILGLPYPGGDFRLVWEQIFEHVNETKINDLILGVCSIVLLLGLRSMKNITSDNKVIDKTIWLISTGRNIIVVCVSAALAYICELNDFTPFRLTGYIKPGLPDISPPQFEIQVGNTTHTFFEATSTLGSGLLVVPLLAILENVALAKVFAKGKPVDATQEMLALGVCNIGSSFVHSLPVTGAFSRGAVNNASGVRTPFGGIYTAIIVMLSLKFFTPCFSYIPKASLAAIIIAAVIFMVEVQVVKPMWRTKKTDLIPALATFVCCLFLRLETGILVGIAINVVFLLYQSARPSVHVDKVATTSGCEYLLITPDRSLAFPSVEYVKNTVSKAGIKQGSSSIPVVIDAKHVQVADFTAANGIKELIDDFHKRNQPLFFFNLKPSISCIFQGVGPKQFIHCNSYQELSELLEQHNKIKSIGNSNDRVIDVNM